jgi:hypothetical protein
MPVYPAIRADFVIRHQRIDVSIIVQEICFDCLLVAVNRSLD